MSAVAGFLLASSLAHSFRIGLFAATLGGISLVIASGCVINNYIDRGIDTKMARTRWRKKMLEQIGPVQTIIYGVVLGVAGFWLLLAFVNRLTALVGAVGLFFYLVMYGVWKRRSPFGTVVGSVSGSMPIVGGYTAVSGRLDTAALVLFLAMTLWQMPHFYAIAMYRYEDYRKAGLPVLPVMRGNRAAKVQIMAYAAAFTVVAAMLSLLGYTGYVYLVIMVGVGLLWLWKGFRGFKAADDSKWGRSMFMFSLVVLMTLSAGVSVGALLP